MSGASNRGSEHWNTSSTFDPPQGIPLYLRRDGDDYHVTDVVGLRFGHGRTVREALQMWASEIEWFCTQPSETLGHPLLGEQQAYLTALKYAQDGLGL